MSGGSAAKTLLQIEIASAKAKGQELTEEEKQAQLKKIEDSYKEKLSPYYAASRLWVDGIIDPVKTRDVISKGIEMANHSPIDERMNVGVIQT